MVTDYHERMGAILECVRDEPRTPKEIQAVLQLEHKISTGIEKIRHDLGFYERHGVLYEDSQTGKWHGVAK